MINELNSEQKRRYSRTITLSEIGEEGQAAICAGSVLLIGAGALGSVAAMYLAAAGVGHIGIADFDTVDITNLQRQIAYSEASAGKPKVDVLASRLREQNSTISVTTYNKLITPKNAAEIFADYDVIVEGSDNPSTKHMTAKICSALSKPCVIGGISRWSGQVMTVMPGDCSYNDIFGENPSCSAFAPCSAAGVIGPLPGVVGSIQTIEALKLLANVGKTLKNRLLIIDALTFDVKQFAL
jgi:adenylyltransferase/sulfurtransferase